MSAECVLLRFLTVEWRVAAQENISDDSDAPHVHRGTVRAGLQDLGSHIYSGEAVQPPVQPHNKIQSAVQGTQWSAR